MGVISAVGVLTAENWAGAKPEDYKGTELDKALQAWGALAGKKVEIPKDLFPSTPQCKIGALDTFIGQMKSATAALEKGKALVNQFVTALKAVQGAAGKAAADLTKLSQAKNLEDAKKQKYQYAAGQASSIGGAAAATLKNYE